MRFFKYWNKFNLNIDLFSSGKTDSNIFVNDLQKIFSQNQVRIIFDVGAHKGKFSQFLFDKFKTSTIYAFEPFPDSFKELSKTVSSNQLIQTFQIALSASDGNKNLFVNVFSETNSLLPSMKLNSLVDKLTLSKDIISVKTETLDTFCAKHCIQNIDILKLDTQGSELEILKGGINLIRSKKIVAIYCEVEFIEIYENQPTFDEIFRYLKQHNYFFYKFYNFNFLETGQLAWADALFILDDFSQLNKN